MLVAGGDVGPTRKWVTGVVVEGGGDRDSRVGGGGGERKGRGEERERGFGPVESSRPRAEACGARTVRWWTARMKGKCGMDGRDIMGSMRQTPSPMRFTVAEGSFKCLISTHYCGRRFVLIFLSLCNCGTRIVNSWSYDNSCIVIENCHKHDAKLYYDGFNDGD